MRCGDSFLMTGPGGFGKAHLWIAVTDPQPGDHPFITHQTVVLYGDSRIVDASRIDALIRDGTALAHKACPAQTLKLIQQGVLSSPYTPRKIIAFCRDAWRP